MRELALYIRLQRVNIARDLHLQRIARARQILSHHLMVDPSRLSRLRTFVDRHEARMDRMLTRIEGSDNVGEASEKKCDDVMDQFESYQASMDSQIEDIATFTHDLERAMGNAPLSAPSSNGAAPDAGKLPTAGNIPLPLAGKAQ